MVSQKEVRETAQAATLELSPEISRELQGQSVYLAGNFYHGLYTPRVKHVLAELTGGSDSPWRDLVGMPEEEFRNRISLNGFGETIPDLHAASIGYMNPVTTWFDETSLLSPEAKKYAKKHSIVSFSLEIAIDKMPQIYAGGLGMLNGDSIREESDMGIPTRWISLFYKGGYFVQEFDQEGKQVHRYLTQSGESFPMSEATGKDGNAIGLIRVPMGDHDVFAKVWEVSVGRNKLYLLDTDVFENENDADRLITGHLYGKANHDTSIRQEMLLAVGGIRALCALGEENPSVYHLQEGHAAFAPLEAIALLFEQGESLEMAARKIVEKTVFTNHTVVVHDFFPKELVAKYLGSIANRIKVSIDDIYELGADQKGRFSMTQLLLNLSRKKNGVSQPHASVLRKHFPGYEIEGITNGIHIETWLSEPMWQIFDQYLGSTWREERDNTEIFEKIRDIPNDVYQAAKQEQKRRLFAYINKKYGVNLSIDALTACVARRFAIYKRNTLIMKNVNRVAALVNNEERPLQIIIGGKAHPADEGGKRMVHEINSNVKDPRLKGKVVVLSDYDMELAHYLVAGVDLWVNTPRRGLEASGTSGMKASVNGVLQLTAVDGWTDEVDWRNKGWTIGEALRGEEIEDDLRDKTEEEELYDKLETEIVPMYYDNQDEWIARMKETQIIVLQQYTTRRMKIEQTRKLYAKIIEEQARQAAA